MSISNYAETAVMDALFNNASAAALQLSNRYVKLHTADPGEAGTTAGSAETTRKSLTSAASSNGVFTSTNDLIWASWSAGSETISHVSIWDNVSAGNCLWTGGLTVSQAVANGNTFQISSGALTVTLD